MTEDTRNIIPVLLGGGLTAYSVALSFRSSYGVISHAFVSHQHCKIPHSDIIIRHIYKGHDDPLRLVPILLKFAAENNGAELFLIPCARCFIELTEEMMPHLSPLYNILLPDRKTFDAFKSRQGVYEMLSKAGIPYPPHIRFNAGDNLSLSVFEGFSYPSVIVTLDAVEARRRPFNSPKTVYRPTDARDAVKTVGRIFAAGYQGEVILQNTISSNDERFLLTTVSDRSGRVVRAVLGESTLSFCRRDLGEYHAAIMTRPPDEISYKIVDLLNGIGFVGAAWIDIIRSSEKTYVLGIEAGLAESCDHLRGAGVSISEIFVGAFSESGMLPDFNFKESYWHHPDHKIVAKYAPKSKAEEMERLVLSGRGFSPFENNFEGAMNAMCLKIHSARIGKDIKKAKRKKFG